MKIASSSLLFVSLPLTGIHAASSFKPSSPLALGLNSVVIAATPQLDDTKDVIESSSSLSRALGVRGGQDSSTTTASTSSAGGGGDGVFGTPITKENLAAFWAVYNAITGALLPAPEKIGDLFGWNAGGAGAMPKDGIAMFCFEQIASTCIGQAVMLYLSIFKKNIDTTKVAAYGSLACGYVNYKAFLNNSYAKVGFEKALAVVNMVVFAIYYLSVFGNKFDVDLISKIMFLPPAILGVIGSIAPDFALKLYGAKKGFGSAADKSAFCWMSRVFALFSLIVYSLLLGEDPMTTAGRVALVYSLMSLDSGFITKDAEAVGVPQSTMISITVMGVVVGLGILLG